MALNNEESGWKKTLENTGYSVAGIDLENKQFLNAVYKAIECAENDFAKQSRVISFIQKVKKIEDGKCV